MIRPAELPDAEAIARLQVRAWRSAYGHLVSERAIGCLVDDERVPLWQRVLGTDPHGTLVALLDDRLVGFASFGPARDVGTDPARTAELYALYVDPNRWGEGVGWGLWSETRRLLIERGFTEVSLWVLTGNGRARRFYERAGFQVDPSGTDIAEFLGTRLPEMRYRMALRTPTS
jgi:ribosomal protein S18 acetylase RimI-like enzyme